MQITIFHCRHCGGFVPEGRADKQYCSNSCKQKNYRWRKKADRYASDAKRNLNNLAAYLQYPETAPMAKQDLSTLMVYCQEIARAYGVTIKMVK